MEVSYKLSVAMVNNDLVMIAKPFQDGYANSQKYNQSIKNDNKQVNDCANFE